MVLSVILWFYSIVSQIVVTPLTWKKLFFRKLSVLGFHVCCLIWFCVSVAIFLRRSVVKYGTGTYFVRDYIVESLCEYVLQYLISRSIILCFVLRTVYLFPKVIAIYSSILSSAGSSCSGVDCSVVGGDLLGSFIFWFLPMLFAVTFSVWMYLCTRWWTNKFLAIFDLLNLSHSYGTHAGLG